MSCGRWQTKGLPAQNDLGVKYATGADHDAREPRGALAVAIQPARERL